MSPKLLITCFFDTNSYFDNFMKCLFQSFLDVQFPNGQLTYVAGEGLTTSAFLPVFNGLLQVQGQYPGETRFSFSYKVCYPIMECELLFF